MRDRRIAGVGDLAGLRIGIESGTLADAILMTFGNGRLIDDITHLVPGRRRSARYRSNAATSTQRCSTCAGFDAYRAAHPDTRLAGSGYYYPIGANRGYVGLASDPDLLVAVNKALTDLQAAGTLARFGQAVGLTYLPPREPAILGDVWQQVFRNNAEPLVTAASPAICAHWRDLQPSIYRAEISWSMVRTGCKPG